MKVHFGDHISFNHKGEHGTTVRVEMELSDGGWAGHYSFDTHGITAEEIAAKVQHHRAHHAKKCARLDSFAAEVFQPGFSVSGEDYRITDCVLREVAGEVELYVDVRKIAQLDRPVQGFPTRERFATIDDVVDNASIVQRAKDRIASLEARKSAHGEVVAAARKLIDG